MQALDFDIVSFLISKAAARRRTTYEELGQAVGWGHPNGRGLGKHLYEIMCWCRDQSVPPLTTIVVKKGEKVPASDAVEHMRSVLGYFEIQAAQEAVFAYDWSEVQSIEELGKPAGDTAVWLTSFWGFDPSQWGCVGFATEGRRKHFMLRTQAGTLVAIYVTKGHGPVHMRGKVVGILEVSHNTGHAKEFISGDRWFQKELDETSRGKWAYALQVTRAWKIAEEEWYSVDELFPVTYGGSNAEFIGSQGVAVDPQEAKKLLSLTVSETQVYGQTSPIDGAIRSLEEALQPSKAIQPANEPYWVGETDGPKHLYILKLTGDLTAYLGRKPHDLEDKMVVKVGFSRSPLTRRDQIQNSYPAGTYRWVVFRPEKIPAEAPYSNAAVAIKGEDAMKRRMMDEKAESLGGEFFLADEDTVVRCWNVGRFTADKG
ncbi:hypothetical protein [Rhizobium sp. HT1-10]|uniref:hypothetical protein n=1 Tax=Rhizobium sp. HT1-10 TaxID=3111638 RepID=UPI003C1D7365